jgi:hypothetical protein
MRGFVITLTSVGLIAMLVILAISLRNAQFATERALMEPLPLIYSSFILDDIAYEFNSLVGPSIWINKDNDSTLIAVSDTLHDENHSAVISAYGAFLAGEVSSRTSSDISANFSNLTGGTMRLFINEDYVYSNSYQANESLFTKPGGTGASSYEINLTVTAVRRAVSHMEFVENGSMNVTIRYTDLNGTAIEEGEVSPDQHNTFSLDYGYRDRAPGRRFRLLPDEGIRDQCRVFVGRPPAPDGRLEEGGIRIRCHGQICPGEGHQTRPHREMSCRAGKRACA